MSTRSTLAPPRERGGLRITDRALSRITNRAATGSAPAAGTSRGRVRRHRAGTGPAPGRHRRGAPTRHALPGAAGAGGRRGRRGRPGGGAGRCRPGRCPAAPYPGPGGVPSRTPSTLHLRTGGLRTGDLRATALTEAVRARALLVPGVVDGVVRVTHGRRPVLELTAGLAGSTAPTATVDPLLAVLAEAADSTGLPLRLRLRLTPARSGRRQPR